MNTRVKSYEYYDYVNEDDSNRVRAIQIMCAAIAERKTRSHPTLVSHDPDKTALWNDDDVRAITKVLRASKDPYGLFRFMDERTGSTYVGYKTRDGREWFHILRQIRNSSEIFFKLLAGEEV